MPNEQTPNNGGTPAVAGDFSPDQLGQMAQWEVESGRLTREQADAMLTVDGAPLLTAPATGPAAELDAQFPPAKAHEYDFPLYGAPGERLTPEQREFDTKARGWLTEARFPKGIGSSLAKEIAREGERSANLSEAERTLYGKSQMLRLEKTWGAETQKRVSLARQLVRDLDKKSPGLVDFLERTNAGNNAQVIAMFAAQAERLFMRQGK